MSNGLTKLVKRGLRFFRTWTSTNYVGILPPTSDPTTSFDFTLPAAPPSETSLASVSGTGQLAYHPITTRNNAGTVEIRNSANTALADLRVVNLFADESLILTHFNGIVFRNNSISGAAIRFQDANSVDEWALSVTGTAKGTSNSGRDFALYAFDNTASLLGAAFIVTRASRLFAAHRLAVGIDAVYTELAGTQTAIRTLTLPDRNGRVVVRDGDASVTNGQLLIGSTADNTWKPATLTAGSNVTITNGDGTITIAASGGGGASITVSRETLSDNKTLISSDANHQFLNPNGATRNVTLPTGFSGGFFVFKNIAANTTLFNLDIRNPANASIFIIPPQYTVSVVWDGTEWQVM